MGDVQVEAVKVVVQEALKGTLVLEPWQVGALVVALFLASILGGLASAYLGKRAENSAVKEDLEQLTRIVEEVKHEVSHGQWVRDRRWEVYWKVLGLAESLKLELTDLARVGEELRDPKRQTAELVGALRGHSTRTQEIVQELWHLMNVARIVCSDDFEKAMRGFHGRVSEASLPLLSATTDPEDLPNVVRAMRKVAADEVEVLVAAARKDLGAADPLPAP